MRYTSFLSLASLFFFAQTLPAHEGSHPGGSGEQPKNSKVKITEENGFRIIEANGLPDHNHGQFPNRRNPHSISSQKYNYRVPLNPEKASKLTFLFLSPFGIPVNGVPFDPGAAEFWNRNPRSGWQYEALSGKIDLGVDSSHAHVQPTGAYHYHGMPTELIKSLGGNESQMLLLGYAADGFPIYAPNAYSDPDDSSSRLKRMKSSYQLKEGTRSGGSNSPGGKYDGSFVQDYEFVEGAGDLDVCNGRVGVTPEYPEGTYYYVLTDDFPFIPRAFRGTPNMSFKRGGPGGGRRGGPPGGPPGGRRGPPPPRGFR